MLACNAALLAAKFACPVVCEELDFSTKKEQMMTNGPHAKIGEVMEIPFPRPRDRARIMEDPQYYKLRNYALDFLFNRYAHDDVG